MLSYYGYNIGPLQTHSIFSDIPTEVIMMEKITMNVSGMQCGGCASTIKEKLEGSEGVTTAKADHKEGKVEIDFDPAKIDVEGLKKIIADAGYKPE